MPMPAFRAYRIHRNDGRIAARFDQVTLDDLTPGDVVMRVNYSDINYKDALAATGTAPILRKYPLAGGIDLAGRGRELDGRTVRARPAGAGDRLRPQRNAGRRLRGVRARAGRLR